MRKAIGLLQSKLLTQQNEIIRRDRIIEGHKRDKRHMGFELEMLRKQVGKTK
jgi:hypothetical protein